MQQNGHIYVCGDVSMAEDVNKTLKCILQDNGVQDVDMAIFSLKVSRNNNLSSLMCSLMYFVI